MDACIAEIEKVPNSVKVKNKRKEKPLNSEASVVVLNAPAVGADQILDPPEEVQSAGGQNPVDVIELDDGAYFLADDFDSPGAGDDNDKGVVPYNPLDAYLSEIRRFKPLSREEEMEVALDYEQTKNRAAAYKLVSSNLWLVVKLAREYERIARNLLDLIQEGNIGLMEAVRNFDPHRGVRFPSYAVWWVRAYMIRFIIANWRLVKIGTTQAQRKLFFNLKKESEKLERQGIYPSPRLLAEKLSVREGDVVEMAQRLSAPDMSVDTPLQDDNDSNLLSVLPSEDESAEDLLARKQVQQLLFDSIKEFESRLTPKEEAIFRGRVLDEDKRTLQELSDDFSISKERVRQIENKLKERLRVHLSEKMGVELEGLVNE